MLMEISENLFMDPKEIGTVCAVEPTGEIRIYQLGKPYYLSFPHHESKYFNDVYAENSLNKNLFLAAVKNFVNAVNEFIRNEYAIKNGLSETVVETLVEMPCDQAEKTEEGLCEGFECRGKPASTCYLCEEYARFCETAVKFNGMCVGKSLDTILLNRCQACEQFSNANNEDEYAEDGEDIW